MSDNIIPKASFVVLPHLYTKLLRTPVGQLSNTHVLEVLSQDKGFFAAIKNSFIDFDSQKDLNQVLQQLTWSGFRDRLSSILLFKRKFGKYPKKSDLELVEAIKKFVEDFSAFEANSNGRLHLLGLYVLSQSHSDQDQKNLSLADLETVKDFLVPMTKKSERIDLLILILFYMSQYVPREKLIILLSAFDGFESLFSILSSSEQKSVLSEIFTYCASIDDKEFFMFKESV